MAVICHTASVTIAPIGEDPAAVFLTMMLVALGAWGVGESGCCIPCWQYTWGVWIAGHLLAYTWPRLPGCQLLLMSLPISCVCLANADHCTHE